MPSFSSPGLLVVVIALVAFARPAAAFGAGNIASISKIEGQNWRHGDIEDALLTLAMARAWGDKKFNKLAVSRVYFGNWLRDYSQALDVGTVKYVSAEGIRLLLCVLGFMTFGYGSGEFEVTAERVNVYRPEDHIDNPKNYADNVDARDYDPRLRGPVDEQVELGIDPYSGMKNYIANERAGIVTSAYHVRRLFTGCIQLGRRYKEDGDKRDLYEALRLMGTGLHCLEDFFAHSNYCELALIEMGERDVFSFCGRDTLMEIEGAREPVYPVVTGTFGGVDFLHSVTGEVSDKMTQNEVDELEGALQEGQQGDTSILRDLLDKIPDGILGGGNKSGKVDELQSNATAAQMENMSVSPREPEEFTRYVQNVFAQVMPAIEFHDDVMKGITEAIESIPVLPQLIEQLENQLSIFVFSLIAPFVVPLIEQIKAELQTGSGELIQSSEREQHNVFYEDGCTDPTHSMLAKDHFSNIVNEVAGRTSAKMIHWVVPQLMDAIDDDSVDIERLMNRVIYGIMHHPAQRHLGNDGMSDGRQMCFESVREWWEEMGDEQRDDYRRKLSREGIKNGENHKEGVYDTGHGSGCCGKLKMRKLYGEPETTESKIASAAAGAIFSGASSALGGVMGDLGGGNGGGRQSEGGGNLVEGILGAAAGSLLGGAMGGGDSVKQTSGGYNDDGSYTRQETEYGRDGGRYAQAEYNETRYPQGGGESQYRQYEQQESYGRGEATSYAYQESTEVRGEYGERREYGEYQERRERRRSGSSGGSSHRRKRSGSRGSGSGSGSGGSHHSRERRRRSGDYERREEGGYGGGYGGGYERRDEGGYGGGYERREESGYGGGGYERREEGGYGGGGYERREEGGYDGGGYERREEGGYGGYGEGEREGYERRGQGYGGGYERREEGGYGGGYGGAGGYGY